MLIPPFIYMIIALIIIKESMELKVSNYVKTEIYKGFVDKALRMRLAEVNKT